MVSVDQLQQLVAVMPKNRDPIAGAIFAAGVDDDGILAWTVATRAGRVSKILENARPSELSQTERLRSTNHTAARARDYLRLSVKVTSSHLLLSVT